MASFTASSGPTTTIFTATGAHPLRACRTHGAGVKRVYSKEVKGYCVSLKGARTTRLELPRRPRASLGITHRFVVVQLRAPAGRDCAVELTVSDTNHLRYRLILSTALGGSGAAAKQKRNPGNPLHCQLPLRLQRNRWTNVVLDVAQLTHEAFGEIHGAMFRCCEAVACTANAQVRNIFSCLENPVAVPSSVPAGLALQLQGGKQPRNVFVDGTPGGGMGGMGGMGGGGMGDGMGDGTSPGPRMPRPSPVPTLPCAAALTPSSALPEESPGPVHLAFGTRVTPGGSRGTPPSARSRRQTPPRSGKPRRQAEPHQAAGGGSGTRRRRRPTPVRMRGGPGRAPRPQYDHGGHDDHHHDDDDAPPPRRRVPVEEMGDLGAYYADHGSPLSPPTAGVDAAVAEDVAAMMRGLGVQDAMTSPMATPSPVAAPRRRDAGTAISSGRGSPAAAAVAEPVEPKATPASARDDEDDEDVFAYAPRDDRADEYPDHGDAADLAAAGEEQEGRHQRGAVQHPRPGQEMAGADDYYDAASAEYDVDVPVVQRSTSDLGALADAEWDEPQAELLYDEDLPSDAVEESRVSAGEEDGGRVVVAGDDGVDEDVSYEDEDEDEAQRIAALYRQLEQKRRQIALMEAEFSDLDEEEETAAAAAQEEEQPADAGLAVEEYEAETYAEEAAAADTALEGEEACDDQLAEAVDDEYSAEPQREDDFEAGEEEEEEEEELIFDPILDCYYSPRTNTYFEKA